MDRPSGSRRRRGLRSADWVELAVWLYGDRLELAELRPELESSDWRIIMDEPCDGTWLIRAIRSWPGSEEATATIIEQLREIIRYTDILLERWEKVVIQEGGAVMQSMD